MAIPVPEIPDNNTRNRIHAAFISIYSTNMSVICGASIYTMVYRALSALVEGEPSSKYAEYYYANHLQLICSIAIMLAIITWVVTAYYWFMTLNQVRATSIDTVIHFLLGACQISAAFLVTMPRYFIWINIGTSALGLVAYGNSAYNVKRANISKDIKNLMLRTIIISSIIISIILVAAIAIFFYVAWPGTAPARDSTMNVVCIVMAIAVPLAAMAIVIMSEGDMRKAEIILGID